MYNDYALFEEQLINSRPFDLQYISFILERTFSIVNHFMLYKNISKTDGDSFWKKKKRHVLWNEI